MRTENHQREVEVAQQNRQRAVVIEVEKVTRAKDLEIVAREREVELQKIEKEALEEQRKNIANVIRERVAVEKTVAQEEERIKEVREVSEAERVKQVILLQAQAEAEQELVRQVKQAEADEARSKHKAVEINTMAQAELEAASKQAEAKKRLAEGIEAERAAPGLADARVLEVTAAAKKDGLAAARVRAEQLIAEARGDEGAAWPTPGCSRRRPRPRRRTAWPKPRCWPRSSAPRRAARSSSARPGQGHQDQGSAEAEVLLQRLNAEAEGLGKKFGALDALSDSARQHEEFRMQLEKSFEEAMAAIAANKDIARTRPRCSPPRWARRTSRSSAARATSSTPSPSRCRWARPSKVWSARARWCRTSSPACSTAVAQPLR